MTLIKVKTNKKLGKMGSFSIPAVKTCPFATELCKNICYAKNGCYVFKNVKNSMEKNYSFSLSDNFVDQICKELSSGKIPVVRIHASGDFYSVKYAEKWLEIAQKNPLVKFYAYTRSWVSKDFYEIFDELQGLENFTLLREGEIKIAFINILASTIFGIMLVFAGYFVSRYLLSLFKQ